MERRLAAVLAADVVGYSRLMSRDEAATLDALKAHRAQWIDGKIAEHHGRIVKSMGDGILVEFASVVSAVACAVEVQRGMAERTAGQPPDSRIQFRIGINLGDVIVEDSDIFGDGVNVAARLESIAQPGGVAISASVREQVGERLGFAFADRGEQALKNIPVPVRVFDVLLEQKAEGRAPDSGSAPAVPARPSVAVLPFVNMSGDPEQEYFADGLVEDLITNLSKMPGFFVIARNSTFAYKGRSIDIRVIARELGVRYVLEGSVRRAASRLRITGQLVEGAGATHVWAGKFEGGVEDIFDLQDKMTESIVGALEPTLRRAEIDRARSKRPDMLDAYDLFLRALPHAYANSVTEASEAIKLLDRALQLDPDYAAAHAFIAWSHEQRFFRDGFDPADREASLRHAERALALGSDNPQALSIGAFVMANVDHDYEAALRTLDRALEMNPNSALGLGFSALVSAFSDRHDRAVDHSEKALRLSPFDPLNYHPYCALAVVDLAAERYADAEKHASLAIEASPRFSFLHTFLVAALVGLKRLDAARAAGRRLLEVSPGFRVEHITRADFLSPARMEKLTAALLEAGLPA